MMSVPLRAPTALGVKVTLIVQLAPNVTDVPQLFYCEKSAVVAMWLMVNDAAPVFVKVTA